MQISDYFYTEAQAAKQLGVNRITIWRWIKAGKLNVQKFGSVVFIPKVEIELLQENVNRRNKGGKIKETKGGEVET